MRKEAARGVPMGPEQHNDAARGGLPAVQRRDALRPPAREVRIRTVVQQQARHAGVPALRRSVQRGESCAIACVDVCPTVDEEHHALGEAAARGKHERRLQLRVATIDGKRTRRAVREQHAKARLGAYLRSGVKRSRTATVEVRAGNTEVEHALHLARCEEGDGAISGDAHAGHMPLPPSGRRVPSGDGEVCEESEGAR